VKELVIEIQAKHQIFIRIEFNLINVRKKSQMLREKDKKRQIEDVEYRKEKKLAFDK
jgi:hypothetical protein